MYIEIHTHIATQNVIFTFSWQSGTLTGKVNMEVSPNIWNRNIFGATTLYAFGVHKQFQR